MKTNSQIFSTWGDKRTWLEDGNTGGHPVGSPEAKEAIERVRRKINIGRRYDYRSGYPSEEDEEKTRNAP